MAVAAGTPVRLAGRLDSGMSRWLWLVKWFLAIPHYVVLAFLWMAFAVVSVTAFVAILVTGRYPPRLFDFNVGVLRWSWRVAYYSYGALGTARYPPFTLADVPDYPARLDVAYPGQLSRGLVLVKWWLLAIPHYLVIGLFLGGATYVGSQAGNWVVGSPVTGLIGLLVVVAAVVLAVTGRYPRGIFDLVLGLNRWVYRVVAYAALMTDEYPPFRLDMGEREPAVLEVGTGRFDVHSVHPVEPAPVPPPPLPQPTPSLSPAPPARPMGAGRVVALVLGSLIGLGSFGLVAAGGAGLALDQTQRDSGGFLSSAEIGFSTDAYAIVGTGLEIDTDVPDWLQVRDVIGDVQIRFDANDADVFVGIARASEAAAYLDGFGYDEVTRVSGGDVGYDPHAGGAPATAPAAQDFWVASASGTGEQTLTFEPQDGRWLVVAMNADGSAGVDLDARVAAELPVLPWAALVVIGAGVVGLLLAVLLVALALRRDRTAGAA
ncbi:DUF4389 domain-containing protein [Jiangella mangrovi]|uniref:DUF4389 domain-containing protein n=1 Tax=Jiangella mangrovi TaxID=1524084 RepID=A0A7W9LM65_9ACTN|nr:DUF4389 domain-containing protein [Jiangella mangrovi]MBB5788787.1 hypothetical protein [Jiangella mangrovi]